MNRVTTTFTKRVYWLLFIVFWLSVGVLLSNNYGLYCNMTKSFPQDYFFVKKLFAPHELHKGVLVALRVDFETPYIDKRHVLLKHIACDSGDRLTSVGTEFFCNQQRIAIALKEDSKGLKMKQFEFDGEIPEGYMFLTAEHPRSYDSRYFGLLNKNTVEAIGLWRF